MPSITIPSTGSIQPRRHLACCCAFHESEAHRTCGGKTVRCRTIGDISCTGLSLSTANTLEEIIEEIAATRVTERGSRADDLRSEAAMEDRKKEGYF